MNDTGDLDPLFLTSLKESFNQEYQYFNLLVRFSSGSQPLAVPIVTVNGSSPGGVPSHEPQLALC